MTPGALRGADGIGRRSRSLPVALAGGVDRIDSPLTPGFPDTAGESFPSAGQPRMLAQGGMACPRGDPVPRREGGGQSVPRASPATAGPAGREPQVPALNQSLVERTACGQSDSPKSTAGGCNGSLHCGSAPPAPILIPALDERPWVLEGKASGDSGHLSTLQSNP